MTGVAGGGTAGYNLVTGQFLLGVEAQFDFSSLQASAKDREFSTPRTDVSVNYLGNVAGRAGFTLDNVLIYAKGGWGFLDADIDWRDSYYESKASGSAFLSGFVLGGGVEYAISERLSAKLEYLRYQLDDTETVKVKGYCCGYEQKVGIDGVNTFTMGVNYHF